MKTGRFTRLAVGMSGLVLFAAPARGQGEVAPTQQPEAAQPVQPEGLVEELDERAKPEEKDKRRSIAEDTTVRVRGGAWITSLEGQLAAGTAFPGTISDIDLIDTLNLDPDRTVFLGAIGFNIGKRFHLDLGYGGPFEFDGTSDPIDISFNEFVFSGNVRSEADLDIYHGELAWDWVEAGPLTVALGFGVRVMDFSATVEGTATDPNSGITMQRTESVDAIVPLPAPGITVRYDFTKRLYARGVLRGVYAGDYGNFFDAVAELGFDFTRNVGVYGGWRWMHGEADVSDVEFNVDLQGPYVGVEVRF